MGKRTPFYDLHLKENAKMVDFSGWEMPLHYGSQLQEHHLVRNAAGMFDVSHMGIVDIVGKDAAVFLRYLLANNIDRIPPGKAIYTCMLNEQGGVIDDLIVYKLAENSYRIIVNAGTREKDLAWMLKQLRNLDATITERHDLVMLAIQGPDAKHKLAGIAKQVEGNTLDDLKSFMFVQINNWFIARTGYTGEDGFELIFPKDEAPVVWQQLLQVGIKPCGLGARDTLRLEAGLNLYGSDMDETVTPLESNLSWTVAFDPKERQFIGRQSLENQQQKGVRARLVGLVLQGPGIMRNHQKVFFDDKEGEITSGGYSPTLDISIALARVPNEVGATCNVQIRNKQVSAQVIKPPFVRHGKKMF